MTADNLSSTSQEYTSPEPGEPYPLQIVFNLICLNDILRAQQVLWFLMVTRYQWLQIINGYKFI